jgi:pSer/pThr/pTyr-binding forkhead associated (FHA) protein
MPRLRIAAPAGGDAGGREIAVGERLTIGRVEGVDLVLDDKGCSRRHCEVVKGPSGYLVRDLGSSNGTSVNGEKVAERALADGDTIRVGGVSLTFLARDADYSLRFDKGEHAGRELALTAPRTTLGRRPDNALSFNDVKVSGVHVEVVKDGDGFVLRDLGSTNGTWLDGRKVTEVALGHGDRVKIGESEFLFVDLRRSADGAADAGGELGAAMPTRAPTLPIRKGRLAATLGLLGIVVAVGAGAAWYFLLSRGEVGPAAGKRVPPSPAGNLLNEEWSFEDPAAAAATWTAEVGDGFTVHRGKAASGSSAAVATLENGAVIVSRRQAEEVSGGRTLHFTGQLSAESGALIGVSLRFLRGNDDAARASALTLPIAHSTEAAFAPFDVEVTPPQWARFAEVLLVARGSGAVAADDFALVPAGAAPAGTKLGDLTILPLGPGASALDHHAPLVALFTPGGSHAVDGGTHVELPPSAFTAEIKADGALFTLESGKAPFAADHFDAEIVPDVAATGLVLMTATASDERFGAFGETEAKAVLIGSAAERFELGIDPPALVSAVARGEGLELRIAPKGPTKVTLRTGFEKERKEASDLYAAASEDWHASRGGAALSKLVDLRKRLPYDEKTLDLARKLDAEIVPSVEAELNSIEAEADAAEFLGSLERWEKTLARAEVLVKQAEGLLRMADFAKRVEEMRATVAAMRQKRREEEARRLLKLARAYESFQEVDRKKTASELLAELQKSYADTAAAKEAAGGR